MGLSMLRSVYSTIALRWLSQSSNPDSRGVLASAHQIVHGRKVEVELPCPLRLEGTTLQFDYEIASQSDMVEEQVQVKTLPATSSGTWLPMKAKPRRSSSNKSHPGELDLEIVRQPINDFGPPALLFLTKKDVLARSTNRAGSTPCCRRRQPESEPNGFDS